MVLTRTLTGAKDVYKRQIPTNFQELMASCQTLREKGLENPMILAGKSINNVAQFDFQYLACVLSHENPKYYEQMLAGELKFTDEIFQEMFDKYGQLKEYVSDDALGVDEMCIRDRWWRNS